MKLHVIAVLGLAALFAGCSAATQNIPVSSTPTGAEVLSDGKAMCQTPCNVELEKTQPHILTLKKDGYQDANVQISRQYDTGKVTRDAVQSGVQQSSWGASAEGAVANALLGVAADEESGNAYVLTPASVVVKMVPVGQAGTAQVNPQAQVQTTQPATMESGLKENPEAAGEALLEGAAAAAPTIGTKKTISSSHHSSGHFNSDGSYSEHSSSTSASVGVKVNPAEAGLGLIKLLEGEEAKKKAAETPE